VTDKSEVLIIGDSLTSDMKGGVLAGIDTCWFNPMHKPNTFDIDVTYEIDDLGKIEGIVETKA
jgi:2-haloacid dehalogenase